MFAAYKN